MLANKDTAHLNEYSMNTHHRKKKMSYSCMKKVKKNMQSMKHKQGMKKKAAMKAMKGKWVCTA